MTVSTTNRKAGPYTGNDVTASFPFVFKVFATTDLVVVTSLAGLETTLVLGVDFSATINADQDNNPGGAITLSAPLPSTKTLIITSAVPATQSVVVTNQGGFYPAIFNGVFDRLTILIQQLAERVGRAFTVPITYAGSAVLPVVPSGVLQWAPDGLSLQAVTLPDLSLSLALPNQAGHANHPLFSNGVIAGWRAITVSDIAGLAAIVNNVQARSGYAVQAIDRVPAQIASQVAAAVAAQSNAQAAFLLNAAVIF